MPQSPTHQAAPAAYSLTALPPRGEWPADPLALPYFLSEPYLAHLLDKSVRTLERHRHDGKAMPYVLVGRQVLYPRDAVIEQLMKSAKQATTDNAR